MKKVSLFFSLLLIASLTTFAQVEPTQFVYAEIVGNQRLFSKKVSVRIDYGQESKLFEDERIRNDYGRIKVFNSMVDALNFMASYDWQFVQAYVEPQEDGNVFHWIMKREKDYDQEANYTPKTKSDFKSQK